MRFTVLSLFVALAAAGATSADAKKELAAMEGKWKPKSMQLGEGKLSEEQLKQIELVIEDGKYVVTANGQKDKGTLKIDTKPDPKSMDIVGTEGPNKGKTFLAIYVLDGDKLKICYALEGKRPTDFKIVAPSEGEKSAPKVLLVTYEKVKDKK